MTKCPTTAKDWEQAEQKISCATGIYHCLKTQLDFLVEVCTSNTLIEKGGCPYWNINGNVDMVDCRKFPQCPDKPFLSNKVYQYPFCYQPWSTTTTYSTTSEVPITTTTMSFSSTVSAERYEYEHLWLFVLMVILSCLVLVVLFVFIIRYHLHARRRQKDPEIPVNGEELTNEPNSRTPLLDGRKEEEKYETEIAGIEIKKEPETPVNGGVLSEETSTQTPFLEPETPVNDGELSQETSMETPFIGLGNPSNERMNIKQSGKKRNYRRLSSFTDEHIEVATEEKDIKEGCRASRRKRLITV